MHEELSATKNDMGRFEQLFANLQDSLAATNAQSQQELRNVSIKQQDDVDKQREDLKELQQELETPIEQLEAAEAANNILVVNSYNGNLPVMLDDHSGEFNQSQI